MDKKTGTHKGGYTGFSFEITSELKNGTNVLAVRLNNQWNARLAPCNGDYNFTGGIYIGLLLWQENDFWGSGGDQQETDNWYSGAGAYPMKEEDRADFEESVKADLKEMIRIHHKHSSIIVWSMCNEPFFTGWGTIEHGRSFLAELTKLTHTLDPTRPIGISGCQRGDIDKLGDIACYNGDGARLFINPGVPCLVSEYGSTIACRPGKIIPVWGDLQQEKIPWRSSEAIWCAFDYGTRAGYFGLMGMIDYFRLPKNMYYWYRNEYAKVPPPEKAVSGTPAKLRLSADKTVISNTDGPDDIFLVVSVLDKDGKQLSNSPDVSLRIVSGPGEFPKGSSITFSNSSDIYIRDGKAAIEGRSYYAGQTIINAASEGLQPDSIIIETKGAPAYIEGETPKTVDRPYIRYSASDEVNKKYSGINIAYQKPTRASSESEGQTDDKANDNNELTKWESDSSEDISWWQLDLENLYTIYEVRFMLPEKENRPFIVELSKDNQNREIISDQKERETSEKW
jgi:beta-galactosidase